MRKYMIIEYNDYQFSPSPGKSGEWNAEYRWAYEKPIEIEMEDPCIKEILKKIETFVPSIAGMKGSSFRMVREISRSRIVIYIYENRKIQTKGLVRFELREVA